MAQRSPPRPRNGGRGGTVGASSGTVDNLPLDEILKRLALALAGGALIGIDRDLHGKSAGLRTFALVSLGTAGVTISAVWEIEPNADNIGRVVQGVLTGIGFLGAGVILRRSDSPHVTGLTTAASVWFTACFAVICGLGEYPLAVALFLLGFLLLLGGRHVERLAERVFGVRYDPKDDPDG
jgi:putative Mg2+ transporter-C (MgtC) family protein